ncbi:unnamed protein product, partial [Meganyctiphanes norvegica]
MSAVWWPMVLTAIFIVIRLTLDKHGSYKTLIFFTCNVSHTKANLILMGLQILVLTLGGTISIQTHSLPITWQDVCLIMDNCTSHAIIIEDLEPRVMVLLLPPNTTALMQPMDQGVIANFKVKYHSMLYAKLIEHVDSTPFDQQDKAWNQLLTEEIDADVSLTSFEGFLKILCQFLTTTGISSADSAHRAQGDLLIWLKKNFAGLSHKESKIKISNPIDLTFVAMPWATLEVWPITCMAISPKYIVWSIGSSKYLLYSTMSIIPHMTIINKFYGTLNMIDSKVKNAKETPYKFYFPQYKPLRYTSSFQLNQKAEENGISLIFLVTQKKMPLYRRISQIITSSSFAEIQEDSSNIVELIRTEYEKVQSKVSLKDEGTSEAISLRYFSKCKNNQLEEKKNCDDLNKGDKVDFTIEVTLNNCDDFEDGVSQKIKISPFGDDKNHVELTVYPLCTCDCEDSKHDDYDKSSPDCNFQGDLKCGVCDCQDGFGGKTCQCDKSAIDAGSSGCRPGNSTVECKGRGTCVCNECECDPGYKGTFCECDNINCDRGIGGLVCSNNGDCDCGVCSCHSGWTGDACACSLKTDNCINPASDIVCSSQGSCECNTCKCNNTVYSYTGVWCETCKDCPDQCEELGPCVLCQHRSQEESESQCEDQCSDFQLEVTFLDHMDEPSEGDVLCSVYDNEECRVSFVYGPGDDGKLNLQILKNKECPKPVPIIAIVLGIVGTIVVLGLIALIAWKCYISHLDKLEYQRFLMEQSNAKWSNQTNPMYKPAIKTTMNPTYSKQD